MLFFFDSKILKEKGFFKLIAAADPIK